MPTSSITPAADADLDALLGVTMLPTSSTTEADADADPQDALQRTTILENQGVAGSPAASRLEQDQREACAEKAEAEAKAALYTCGGCGAGQAKMKCGGCASVRYCGEQCQRAHWLAHKGRCKELKAEAAAAAAASGAVAASAPKVKAKAQDKDEEEKEGEEVVHNCNHLNKEAGNCWTCGVDNPRNMCNRCKVAKYCGVTCQTENWPIHKGRCAYLKTQSAVVNMAKNSFRKIRDSSGNTSQIDWREDLNDASLLGRVVDIERIIAAGGSVVDDHRPLNVAAQEGHARAIEVLVRHGARVNAQCDEGKTGLIHACIHGQLKAAAALLGCGARIDLSTVMGFSPLYVACQFNRIEVVALLLEHGAQVDSRDEDGCCPLYVASQLSHLEIVVLLLGKGAQVDCRDKDDVTPCCIAAEHGHAAVVRLLLEHGAQMDSKDNDGGSPLYLASQNNHPEVVALLLQHGAQVDILDEEGVAPLSIAAQNGHAAVVRLLLEHGAQVDLRSNDGSSAPGYGVSR